VPGRHFNKGRGRVLAHLTHVLINLKALKSYYTVPKWFCFILPYRIKNRLRIRDYSEIEALLSNYSSADDTDNLIEELVEVLDTDFYAEFSTPEHTYVCNITFVPLVPAEYTDVKLSLSR